MVQAFRASGMTMAAFARRERLNYATFAGWVAKARLTDARVSRRDPDLRIYVAVQPVDVRKSFNGLWSAVSEQLHEDPKSGALFAFINKEHTRLKLLYWDGTGVWLLAKRLEHGASPGWQRRTKHQDRARPRGAVDAGQWCGLETGHAEAVVRALIRIFLIGGTCAPNRQQPGRKRHQAYRDR